VSEPRRPHFLSTRFSINGRCDPSIVFLLPCPPSRTIEAVRDSLRPCRSPYSLARASSLPRTPRQTPGLQPRRPAPSSSHAAPSTAPWTMPAMMSIPAPASPLPRVRLRLRSFVGLSGRCAAAPPCPTSASPSPHSLLGMP
jgi:hypothetical protein